MEIQTAMADLQNRNAATLAPAPDIGGLKATMTDFCKTLQQDVGNIEATLAKVHARFAEVACRILDVTGSQTAMADLNKHMQEVSTKVPQVQ